MSVLIALIRNSAVLLAGTAAAKGLVFVSTLVLTRMLGPEDFGRYSLIFAYLAFFELIADAGLDSLALREQAQGEKGSARRLGDAIVLRAGLAAVVIPLAVLAFPLVSPDRRDLPLVAIAGATLIASNRRTSLARLLEIPFRMRLRMGIPTLLGALAETLHLALLPLAIGAAGVAGAVGLQALAPLPFALVLLVYSLREVRPELRPRASSLVALARSAAPLMGIVLLNVFLVRVDVIMLRMLRGSVDVGLYSAPVRLVETANLLPILLMTSVYPLMAAAHPTDPARRDVLFRGSLRLLIAVLTPIAAIEILFARPLLGFLFGVEYLPSSGALPPLALAEFLIFTDVVVTYRFVAARQERWNLLFVLLAALVNIGANLMLIPTHGIAGAAVATLLAYAVRLLAALAVKETRAVGVASWETLLPPILAGGAAFGLPRLLPLDPGAAAVVGFVLYPLALGAIAGPRFAREVRALASRRVPGGPSARPRILWVSSPVSSCFGGGERLVQRLIEGLPDWDHEFLGSSRALLDLFRRRELSARDRAAGWEPIGLRGLVLFPLSFLVGGLHFVRHFALFRRADVVVSPTSFTEVLTLFPWLIGILGRRPVLIVQNARVPRTLTLPPLRWILRRVQRSCAPVLVSESLRRTWRERGLDAGGIEIVTPGVPIEKWTFRPVDPHVVRLGTLSRLHREKGIDTVLTALSGVDSGSARLEVFITGEGPDEEGLRALAERHTPPDSVVVRWLGPVEDAAAFLAPLDALLVPSRRESFGLAVVEAWERGIPVIGSDLPALSDLRAKAPPLERELVFPAGDARALADRITELIRRRAEFRGEEHARALRETVRRHHSAEVTVERFADVLSRVENREISPVAETGVRLQNPRCSPSAADDSDRGEPR
jgi:O-antigen/teichoic acid export membrane protein